MTARPWQALLDRDGFVVIDGGLATELERRGHVLDTPLWSASLLADAPAEIAAVHRAYLEAGASIIISASYQASIEGFRRAGVDEQRARKLLLRSVAVAREVRDGWGDGRDPRPLVAASIGPFGAVLADGSEYRGNYRLDRDALAAFHRPRLELLDDAGADLLAVETIPSLTEAEALAGLLGRCRTPAWVCFSCADQDHLRDGSRIEDAALLFRAIDRVVAVGVNCTEPRFVLPLVQRLTAAAPDKDIVVYPNRGEDWDAASRSWCGDGSAPFAEAAEWFRAGARLIGGCCRTTPADIAALRDRLHDMVPDRE